MRRDIKKKLADIIFRLEKHFKFSFLIKNRYLTGLRKNLFR